jgi:hypothetical protein
MEAEFFAETLVHFGENMALDPRNFQVQVNKLGLYLAITFVVPSLAVLLPDHEM